jgi:hypothetical protein
MALYILSLAHISEIVLYNFFPNENADNIRDFIAEILIPFNDVCIAVMIARMYHYQITKDDTTKQEKLLESMSPND